VKGGKFTRSNKKYFPNRGGGDGVLPSENNGKKKKKKGEVVKGTRPSVGARNSSLTAVRTFKLLIHKEGARRAVEKKKRKKKIPVNSKG